MSVGRRTWLYVRVAQNLSGHSVQRRVGVPGNEFGNPSLALLALSSLVFLTPRAGQGMAAATPR